MGFEEYVNNLLWEILVETVHAMIMFPYHKAYTRDSVLNEQSTLTAQDLATKLSIPRGEALVILYELQKQKSEESKRIVDEEASEI